MSCLFLSVQRVGEVLVPSPFLLDPVLNPCYPFAMVEQPFSADAYSALEHRLREPTRALLKRIYHPLVCRAGFYTCPHLI